ncbi:MAG: hypothetical protein A2Z15_08685 [Chloroflexi bacterium RBG_16_50_11]|nr:MAG: hypothetical protein A2Z15_08685 [Chloroflexi bacterium RBG_16_50_11]
MDNRISSVVRGLAEALDNRNFYNLNHSKLVTDMAMALGQALKLDQTDMNRLEVCSLLHDIGKISISEAIINKPGKLDQEEWELMKTHTRLGADFAGRVPYLTSCADGILHHHEHFDGQGYPDGLKGDAIPLEGRILAVADAYAAMTTERAYSGILAHEQALEELKKCAGSQFDPALVELFLSLNANNNPGMTKKARR